MITSGTSGSITGRMLRASRLDVNLYEEVEADESATGQAATVVVIVAIASAIGAALSAAFQVNAAGVVGAVIGGVIGAIISALVGWVVWAYLTYWIGTAFFGGTATPGEMLRTIGFAQSPAVLRIFTFIPIIGGLINLVLFFWLLIAGIIAVRQALDISTGKAVLTAIIGWIGLLIVTAIVAFILAAIGLGVNVLTSL